MRTPELQTEACKLCNPTGLVTWMVVLRGEPQQRVKCDTGIAMLGHIGQIHPEAIGLPSHVEQQRQRQQEAYKHALEEELKQRRN